MYLLPLSLQILSSRTIYVILSRDIHLPASVIIDIQHTNMDFVQATVEPRVVVSKALRV